MPQHPVDRVLEAILPALQVLQVVFLWIHDWIPLGRLNDVIAVRSQDTLGRLATDGSRQATSVSQSPLTGSSCIQLRSNEAANTCESRIDLPS